MLDKKQNTVIQSVVSAPYARELDSREQNIVSTLRCNRRLLPFLLATSLKATAHGSYILRARDGGEQIGKGLGDKLGSTIY